MRPVAFVRSFLFGALGVAPLVVGCEGTVIGSDVCTGPELPTATGEPSGYVACENGHTHRAYAAACDPTNDLPACAGTEAFLSCTTDADCTERPNGRCNSFDGFEGTSCGCVYTCAGDADCDAGEVCVCSGVLGAALSQCVTAGCTTDADCPSKECGITSFDDGCSTHVELACRSDADACDVKADCLPSDYPTDCAISGGAYACLVGGCVIGRPLVVEGTYRTAPAARRDDWAADVGLLVGLEPAARAAAGARWSEIAALEHASVASFSRFALSLLALGAPAHLVARATEGALDEIRHARRAYALAGALLGRPVGPGPLPEASSPLAVEREAFVRALAFEGCVGETLGALEAARGAELAVGPELRAGLEEVAADEARHAALAWETLRWIVASEPSLAATAAETFAEAERAFSAPEPAGLDDPAAPAVGLLSARETRALRVDALRTVVAPLARAILPSA